MIRNEATLCMGGLNTAAGAFIADCVLYTHTQDTTNAVAKGTLTAIQGNGGGSSYESFSTMYCYIGNGGTTTNAISKSNNTANGVAKGGTTSGHNQAFSNQTTDSVGYLMGSNDPSTNIDAMAFATDTASMVSKAAMVVIVSNGGSPGAS